jgi:hypothetical protein
LKLIRIKKATIKLWTKIAKNWLQKTRRNVSTIIIKQRRSIKLFGVDQCLVTLQLEVLGHHNDKLKLMDWNLEGCQIKKACLWDCNQKIKRKNKTKIDGWKCNTWCTIPEPCGTTKRLLKAEDAHLRQAKHSLFCSNSSSMFAWTAFTHLTTSACTEWSRTRSAGILKTKRTDSHISECTILQWKKMSALTLGWLKISDVLSKDKIGVTK